MNGYQINESNLNGLSRIGNSNQTIGDIQPQGTITTIPLTLIITSQVCVPVSAIYVTFKDRCFEK